MGSKVKFFLILGVIILGISVYGYFKAIPGPQGRAENASKIEITPKFFDFGEVSYGQLLEFNFKLKNSGNEFLEIKRVATSCACTTAKVVQEKINPGEEADLKITYDTGAMSGAHGKGRQERIIYVKSNDPINPQVEVLIYANVK